jgi:molybdopterin molybdotransferase
MMTVDEALAWLLERAKPAAEIEEIATQDALGRVLARPLAALVSAPPLDNSAMDGYAVAVADLAPSGETVLPVSQRIPAGSVGQPLARGTAARIFTGAPVPPGADAVVMQEYCAEADGQVTVGRQPKSGENIRRAGEDFSAGAPVLAAGTRLGPQHMGLAAAAGHGRVTVYRRLKVAAFFTGDEIVMPGDPLKPGQIYNSNRFTLHGLLAALGCEVIDLGIVPDNFDATVAVLRRAAEQADAVITSGGVSVGEEDHVKAAVESVGQLTMWKVSMKPGKPLAFGELDKAFFLGLPGNPVSAFVTFCLFVRPFLLRCQGVQQVAPAAFILPAAFERKKAGERREFARAKLESGPDGFPCAALYPNQGSGALSSVAWADGLVELAEGKTVERGQSVKFIPFSELLS